MPYQRHDKNNNPKGLSSYQRHDKDGNPVLSIDTYQRHDVNNQDVDISDLIEVATDVFGNVYRNLSGGYVPHNVDNEILNLLGFLLRDSTLDLNFASTKSLVNGADNSEPVTFSRASSATYVGADGLIKTAAVDDPRFDHDPVTGESLGLLVEESRTNFAPNSDSVPGSSIGTAIPHSTASVVSPRGITETVRQLGRDVPAGGAQSWRVGSTSGGTPNTTYTISFYAKTVAGGTTTINVDINDSTPEGGQTTTITGEWTRIVKTGGSRPNTLRFFDMNMVTATQDFYVWGAQIEEGTFATSYIPTTSSQVTRAADVVEITGTNFSSFYNQSEGIIFVDNSYIGLDDSPFVFDLSDGTADNRHSLFYLTNSDPITLRARTRLSSDQSALEVAAPASGVFAKTAYAYASNDFAISSDGSIVLTDSSGSIPTINQLTIGANFANASVYSGHIKRFIYWPLRSKSLFDLTTLL